MQEYDSNINEIKSAAQKLQRDFRRLLDSEKLIERESEQTASLLKDVLRRIQKDEIDVKEIELNIKNIERKEAELKRDSTKYAEEMSGVTGKISSVERSIDNERRSKKK
jgi:SMC interacting uncharacterized protein involved in chromosome segregation